VLADQGDQNGTIYRLPMYFTAVYFERFTANFKFSVNYRGTILHIKRYVSMLTKNGLGNIFCDFLILNLYVAPCANILLTALRTGQLDFIFLSEAQELNSLVNQKNWNELLQLIISHTQRALQSLCDVCCFEGERSSWNGQHCKKALLLNSESYVLLWNTLD
jgi:hypothetical protein